MSEAANAGSIYLDLLLNQKKFNKQLSGVEGIAKRAGRRIGGAIAAGLTVKAFASFTKDCLNLGSDLTEVQNVVDTAFPKMSEHVDQFAKKAATSFGLSETMAKRYTGTFGAMSKSFGFTEKEAYNMSTALTGLAGDIASFYNISQDEAYTKLKSVFTGETETLKELGVVMTQNALDQYALANGFGKTTSAMTEQEKVALRYQFVMNQLSMAQGDFAKTSNSWANQVRILSLQFESFKAALGQGFINVLTPVIQTINMLMAKLVALANAFKRFTEIITGRKSQGTAIASTASDVDDLTSSANNAAGSVGDIGKSASKTAKQLKRALFGFDQINKLDQKDSGTGGASGAGAGGSGGAITGLDAAMDGQAEKATKLSKRYNALKKSVDRLKTSFSGFTTVIMAGLRWAWENILKPLGEWTLQKLAPKLINLLASAFDVLTVALKTAAPVFAAIWKGFFEPIAKFTGKLILVFLEALTIALTGLANFIDKHPTLFQGILTSIIGLMAISKVARTVNVFRVAMKNAGSAGGAFAEIFPKIGKLAKGTGKILKVIFTPKSLIVLGIMAAVTAGIALYKNWDKIKKAAKKIGKEVLKPFQQIREFFVKTWKNALKKGSDAIEDMRDRIKGVVSGLETYFGGWVDFITGVFSGNWEKAWTGVREIFSGIWETITSALNLPDVDVKATLTAVKDAAFDTIAEKWEAFKDKTAQLLAEAKEKASGAIATLRDKWDSIKSKTAKLTARAVNKNSKTLKTLKNAWNSFKSKTVQLTAKFKDVFTSPLKSVWNAIARKINSAITTINKIPGVNISGRVPYLAQGAYVKKNTPQLAVIGDNRHQGEIVAPEDKMLQMARQAAAMSGGGVNSEVIALLQAILAAIEALELDVYLDGKPIKKRVVDLINANTKATGVCEIIV